MVGTDEMSVNPFSVDTEYDEWLKRNNLSKVPECELITVKLGCGESVFKVHRDVLCDQTTYFEKYFREKRFADGREKIVHLTQLDPTVFGIILEWLYRGPQSKISRYTYRTDPDGEESNLGDLYIGAAMLGIERLENFLMDEFRRDLEEGGGSNDQTIFDLIDHGLGKSKLYKYLLAGMIFDMKGNNRPYRSLRLGIPEVLWISQREDMAKDVIEALLNVIQGDTIEDPKTSENCVFHRHQKTPRCSK